MLLERWSSRKFELLLQKLNSSLTHLNLQTFTSNNTLTPKWSEGLTFYIKFVSIVSASPQTLGLKYPLPPPIATLSTTFKLLPRWKTLSILAAFPEPDAAASMVGPMQPAQSLKPCCQRWLSIQKLSNEVSSRFRSPARIRSGTIPMLSVLQSDPEPLVFRSVTVPSFVAAFLASSPTM